MSLKSYLSRFNLVYVADVTHKWKRHTSPIENATLREIAPNEVVIEYDTYKESARALVNNTIRFLHGNNYNFAVYDHGGRSPHIHVYDIRGLEELDDDMRRTYKKLFISKYAPYEQVDYSLTGIGLIALEHKPHFKYGTIKKLVYNTHGFSNSIEMDMLNDAYNICNTRIEDDISRLQHDNRWILKWILDFDEYLHNMDIWLFKNVAITLVNDNMDIPSFVTAFERVYGRTRVGHLFGWIRWAQQNRRYFCLSEIIKFCEMYGLDYREVIRIYRSNRYMGDSNNARKNN